MVDQNAIEKKKFERFLATVPVEVRRTARSGWNDLHTKVVTMWHGIGCDRMSSHQVGKALEIKPEKVMYILYQAEDIRDSYYKKLQKQGPDSFPLRSKLADDIRRSGILAQ
jgi:hypothetical protein